MKLYIIYLKHTHGELKREFYGNKWIQALFFMADLEKQGFEINGYTCKEDF